MEPDIVEVLARRIPGDRALRLTALDQARLASADRLTQDAGAKLSIVRQR
jgi:hypothetical protein